MQLHSYVRHHPRLQGVRLEPRDDAFPAGTFFAHQVAAGYGVALGSVKPVRPVKIGILSLGGSYVASDLQAGCKLAGIPMPGVQAITAPGAQQDPSDTNSNVENQLDLQCVAGAWYQATKTPADIVICFGPNGSGGMLAALKALIAAGCTVISISWGGPVTQWSVQEYADLEQGFLDAANAGVTILAASGDNSIDDGTSSPVTDYPSCSTRVWAVGGTKLVLNADGSYASERAWGDGRAGDEGGGGGYDTSVPTPPWQAGVLPAGQKGRGSPDTSAVADPNTGYRMFVNGSATVVGGTSGATPLTAGLVAASKSASGQQAGFLLPLLYANRLKACRQITQGSNGDPTGPGWNGATGNGSPNGAAFIAALIGTVPVSAPTPAPAPAPPSTDGGADGAVDGGVGDGGVGSDGADGAVDGGVGDGGVGSDGADGADGAGGIGG